MRTPARPRLPDGDCVFISDVRIVARAVIAGAPRDLEGRSSVHGAASCNYSPISTRVTSLTWGFANCSKAARVDQLAIAAGGLQATGRLSFKAGVFGAIEPLKAARRALWGKNENSKPRV